MSKDPKPLESWQIDDAARLKALYKAKTRLSQEEFGARYDIGTQGMVWQYLNGRRPLNIKAATAFAEGLGVQIEDFSVDLARQVASASERTATNGGTPEDEFDKIRRLDVKASAGKGRLIFAEPDRSRMAFRKEFLRGMSIKPDNAVMIYAIGSSMEPTIPDGAVVLVDMSKTEIQSGAIYVVQEDGELSIKRVRAKKNGDVLVISDNPDKEAFPDRIYTAVTRKHVEIKGRACWMGTRL